MKAAILMAAAVLVGCAGDIDLARRAESPETQRLVGTWAVHLQVDQSPFGVADSDTGRVASGELVLVPNRTVPTAYPPVGVPLTNGTYDIDLSTLGLDLGNRRVPSAVAGSLAGDSVGILIEPTADGGALILRGAIVGDTIRGMWNATLSRATGAGGRFALVRSAAQPASATATAPR